MRGLVYQQPEMFVRLRSLPEVRFFPADESLVPELSDIEVIQIYSGPPADVPKPNARDFYRAIEDDWLAREYERAFGRQARA